MDKFNVKIETLTNDNYPIWEMQMEALLDSKDLFDDVIIKNEPIKIESNAESVTAYNEWLKKNKEAYSLIILSISPEIAIIFKGIKNAKQIWNSLKTRFEGEVEDKIMNLYLKLTKLKKINNENIDHYITRAQGLSNEISQLGRKITERELVRYIVEGLPEKYNVITATLIANRGITLSHLRQVLLDFENKIPESRNNLSASVFRSTVSKNKKCFICSKTGHFQNQCWFNPQNKKNTKNKTNKKYFDKREEAKLLQENKKTTEFALFTCLNETIEDITEWHLDSACTSHMTNNIQMIVNKEECQKEIVTAEKERSIHAVCEGDILVSPENNKRMKLKLENVLYVPDLNGNLLSVSSIVEKGNKVNFDKNGVKIYSNDGTLLCKGKIQDGLFTINLKPREIISLNDTYCFKTSVNSVDLWHKRLGHINISYLKLLEQKNMVYGIDKLNDTLNFCESCYKGKMPRNEGSNTYSETTTKPLERLFVDLCGPTKIETLGGRKYMMIIVDQYTRRYFVELLFSKDEAIKKLKEIIERRENELNLKVKRIRSDNGKEFVNEELENYFINKGIKHEKTIPYSPRSNGIAERGNRTLLDMARTMLIEANLPLTFWGEAVNTAAYIYNVTPTKAKSEKTPLELWTGRKPSIKHLRTFGCSVIYKVNDRYRHKLEPKGKQGILVGYSRERKAYRIYSFEEDRIYETSDVTFNEEKLGIPENANKEENESKKENYNVLDYDFITHESETKAVLQQDELNQNGISEDPNLSEITQDDHETTRGDPEITQEDSEVIQEDTEEISVDENTSNGRRPARHRKPPDKLGDYFVYSVKEETPKTYEEAIRTKEEQFWREAMMEELSSMEANEVWELVERPKNEKIIKSRWVFTKKDQDTPEVKYKARLVAAGYNQIKGKDYEEGFSPVMRLATFRTLLSVAAYKNYKVRFFDVKTAYLNGHLEKPIYLEQPPGYVKDPNKVYYVKKSIYGLPNSGRCWYEEIRKVLKEENLTQLKSDPCIFIYKDQNIYLIIAIYVDDIMVIGNSNDYINNVISRLSKSFNLREVTKRNTFLGIDIKQESGKIIISQNNYISKLLKRFKMEDSNPVKTPGALGEDLKDISNSPSISQTQYQEAIGSLMYLATGTRPDLAFAVSYLSQFNKDPREKHWKAVKRIFRYIKGTQNIGLEYTFDDGKLNATSDASWCTTEDSKSFGGYFVKLGKNILSWKCNKQRIVALSTMEAELLSFCESVCEIKWYINLLEDIKREDLIEKPVKVKTDSQALINWIKNPKQSNHSRHINRKYFFVKDEYEQKIINPIFVYSEQQEADILTKYLPFETIKNFLDSMDNNLVTVT